MCAVENMFKFSSGFLDETHFNNKPYVQWGSNVWIWVITDFLEETAQTESLKVSSTLWYLWYFCLSFRRKETLNCNGSISTESRRRSCATPALTLRMSSPSCEFLFVSQQRRNTTLALTSWTHTWTDKQSRGCVCVFERFTLCFSHSPKPSRVFSFEAPLVLSGDLFLLFSSQGSLLTFCSLLCFLNVILTGLLLFMCWTYTLYFYVNVLTCLMRKCWDYGGRQVIKDDYDVI